MEVHGDIVNRYQRLSFKRTSAKTNTACRCSALIPDHSVISCNVRPQPRHTSLSSKQQFRTQGPRTVSGAVPSPGGVNGFVLFDTTAHLNSLFTLKHSQMFRMQPNSAPFISTPRLCLAQTSAHLWCLHHKFRTNSKQ